MSDVHNTPRNSFRPVPHATLCCVHWQLNTRCPLLSVPLLQLGTRNWAAPYTKKKGGGSLQRGSGVRGSSILRMLARIKSLFATTDFVIHTQIYTAMRRSLVHANVVALVCHLLILPSRPTIAQEESTASNPDNISNVLSAPPSRKATISNL